MMSDLLSAVNLLILLLVIVGVGTLAAFIFGVALDKERKKRRNEESARTKDGPP